MGAPNRTFNPRSKHIALRYHSTGDLQEAGVLQLRYLPTDYMPSDVLTKGLPFTAHTRHAPAFKRCQLNPPGRDASEMQQPILGLYTAPRPLRLMIWT